MRAVLLFAFFLATAPLAALTVKPLSFTELVDTSVAVLHGRVIDVRGQWTADRHGIESLVTVEAFAYLKGQLGPRVTVRVPGGRAAGFVNIIPGAPVFADGDHVVLFLTANGPTIPVVTGTTQGVFRVTTDPRDGGLMVVPPVIDTAGSAPVVRGDVLRRPLSLEAFRNAIAAVKEAR
jgi:hypothetical protein